VSLTPSLAGAEERRIDGTVKAVDAEKSTITLGMKARAETKDETLDVLRKAKIKANGQTATLKDLRRGQRVVAVFDDKLEVVTRLEVTGEGIAPMVPEITIVNELPEPNGHHTGPWPSADGLTLYWKTQPGLRSDNAWIWSAHRKSKDGFFEDGKRLVPGSDMTVTADGLEMILVQGESLWVTSRPSIGAAFVRPRKVPELQGHGFLCVPCLSRDDLILYADRILPGQPVAPVKFTRANRRAKWGAPTAVKIALPADKAVRFFSVTPDGSRAFGLLIDSRAEPPGRALQRSRNEIVTMRAEQSGFGRPVAIRIDGEPLQGIFPRYVPATNELFFARSLEEGKPAVIVLVRNFDPDTVETIAVAEKAQNPTRGDLDALQGRWISVFEENEGKQLASRELKSMNKVLTVNGNRLTIRRMSDDGQVRSYDGTFRLEPLTVPRQLDWAGTGPRGADIEIRAIYELKGDTLRWCHIVTGQGLERPDAFEAPPGSRRVSNVFKRMNK
jgi:uncharacterized protein (TIGR03067 family)